MSTAAKPQNVEIWDTLARTDPKYVKPITGRQYKGNSPNPTYIARKLTEVFGPATQGWGTQIMDESYQEFGEVTQNSYQKLHTVTLRLWVGTRDNYIEQKGTTKVAYWTNPRQGARKFHVDDDAEKKSVTDAFVKCASLLGCAWDIFSGRWDDMKYQQENAEHHNAGASADDPLEPGPPPAGANGNGGGRARREAPPPDDEF